MEKRCIQQRSSTAKYVVRVTTFLLLSLLFGFSLQAQSPEQRRESQQGLNTAERSTRSPEKEFSKTFTLSGSEHEIVNGEYVLNGLNQLGQPRYTHVSGDYDMNYDGNGTWWLNTDKNLSGGAQYYRAAGDGQNPPLAGWVDDKGQSTALSLVADARNAAFDTKMNAPKPVITYVSREGTDDIDPNQVIEVAYVRAEQVLNANATAMAKSLTEANSTHYVYNLRVGWYRINDSNSNCDFSGENPDPRYQVSTNIGFNQTINPGDDKNCGWQRMDNDGRYMLVPNGNYALTSAASPYSFTMDVFSWEEDACGDDNTYNDDCTFNDDDHPTSTSTTITINPSMMSLGYNSMDVNWSGNGAQYGLRLEWELLPALKLVTMYSSFNLDGRTQDFGAGDYNVNSLFTGVGNDNVSSMQIAPGYKVITYNNSDYVGYPMEFRGTVNNVGGPNKRISSFQVVPDDNAPDNDKTLLIYFNGSGKSLEFQLQRFATQVNADQMIFIKGVGGATQNYNGYNQLNLQHQDEEDVDLYSGFDAFNPFPTIFYSRAKVFKNDNFGGGAKRYFFGVDMDYDGSVTAGYEDEDSYTAAANVLRVLRRYNLKGYSRIIISGHSRGSAVGISSFLYGMKKAIENDPQFAEFQGLVNDIFGTATTINVLALDPVAGADTPGLRNDYHMGDGWRAREVYQWLKGRFSNINFSEIYANGGRMLESDELLGLGGFLFSNTFDPSPNYLHVEPSNNVQRYWLGYRHSTMVNKEEKWSELYDAAGISRPWLHTAEMLNAGFYDQTLFRNHQHWYDMFQTSDQKAWLKALDLYGCADSPSAQVGLDPLVVPDADLEFQHYHGTRHTTFNNSDDSPVNMDDFVGNNNIKFNCSEVYQAPVAPGLYQASTTYTDGEGWTYYCSCQGKLLLALKPGSSGANIPTSGVSINVPNNSTYYAPGGAGFITNPNGAVMMGRTWSVNPASQPSSNMGVRFYFNAADYENVNTHLMQRNEPPLSSVEKLFFYRATSGAPHANVADIPTANILRNGLAASTTNWLRGATERGGDYFAEFQVASLSGGGGGGESCLPAISCPTNISVNNTPGLCSAVVNYTPPVGSTPGNCSNVITTQTAGLPSGSAFPVGVTTNTFLVTAANGRTTTCSFTVTVTDTQLPTITCPGNIAVANNAGVCGAVVDFTTPVGADNCLGAVTVQTLGLPAGSTYPVGATTNIFRVTAANGQTATCAFAVSVTDTQAPTISCPANISVVNAAGQCSTIVNYATPVGSDNCPGATTQQTAGLPSGSAFPVGTTTNCFTVTAANGQMANCCFTVTVTDTQAPTISCPANISVVNAAGQCSTIVTYASPVGSDNCPGATTQQTAGLPSGSAFPVGTTTNCFTVTAANGQTANCCFTVTVTDTQAPTISCPANISVNTDLGQCSAVVNYTQPLGADNCPAAMTFQTAGLPTGSAFPVGTTTNCFTVTAANGQTANCCFTVTVTDNQAPAVTCSNQTIIFNGQESIALNTNALVTATDNCGIQSSSLSLSAINASQVGQTVPVTVTVTDIYSNTCHLYFSSHRFRFACRLESTTRRCRMLQPVQRFYFQSGNRRVDRHLYRRFLRPAIHLRCHRFRPAHALRQRQHYGTGNEYQRQWMGWCSDARKQRSRREESPVADQPEHPQPPRVPHSYQRCITAATVPQPKPLLAAHQSRRQPIHHAGFY
jgi:hypothetical protein